MITPSTSKMSCTSKAVTKLVITTIKVVNFQVRL